VKCFRISPAASSALRLVYMGVTLVTEVAVVEPMDGTDTTWKKIECRNERPMDASFIQTHSNNGRS